MRYLELQVKIRAFCKEHHDEMMADLAQLVAVPSVVAEPLPGKPYGEAPYEVLHRAERFLQRQKRAC